MYKIHVRKINSLKRAEVSASHVEALTDHLKASAARHGFTVIDFDGFALPLGEIRRDGKYVARWYTEEVPA